jgi:hypothetical protein
MFVGGSETNLEKKARRRWPTLACPKKDKRKSYVAMDIRTDGWQTALSAFGTKLVGKLDASRLTEESSQATADGAFPLARCSVQAALNSTLLFDWQPQHSKL